jgi:glycosyltransferase involved in cell wall biosynthesis
MEQTSRDRQSAQLQPIPHADQRKILVIVNVDIMAWVLLRSWLFALKGRGFDVHIACSRGAYWEKLAIAGFRMHAVNLRRTFNPVAHIRPVIDLIRLIRMENFQLINMHSPVAAAVGRLAGVLSGVDTIIYTVHGFYFHDRMPRIRRFVFSAIEWLLGRFTDAFMFVSEEDRQTAHRLGIASPNARTCTISNGVDIGAFRPHDRQDISVIEFRRQYRVRNNLVIGTVGRIVKEKGYRELLEMAARLTAEGLDAIYLVVGDSLPSDRDQFGQSFRRMVADSGLSDRFVFTGMTDRVADCLAVMDIFVLASHREGFPRSILEAMAAALPVVATDIRGCREAVVNGVSGLIVPPGNAVALTNAVRRLVNDPFERVEMGRKGRAIAVERYDTRIVQERFADFVEVCARGL